MNRLPLVEKTLNTLYVVFTVSLRMNECVRMSEVPCMLFGNKNASFIRTSDILTHSFLSAHLEHSWCKESREYGKQQIHACFHRQTLHKAFLVGSDTD